MVEMMGFEKDRRIIRQFNNTRVNTTVGVRTCHFRSILEYQWAKYLQFLLHNGQIKDWFYEETTFDFTLVGYSRGPFIYLVDFDVIENDGETIYQECKGHHDSKTNSKLQRVAACFPEVKIDLVLQRIPKSGSKGASRRAAAAKYTRRIIDASEIFKQTRGLVDYAPPI